MTPIAPNSLDLAALLSCSIGTASFMLGLLLFFRCKAIGYGWLFPIAVAFLLTGSINTIHAVSLLNATSPWINPKFSRPLETSLIDALLLLGFLASHYRIRKKMLTNSIIAWTFIMLVSSYIVIIGVMALHLNAELVFNNTSMLPNGMLWTSLIFPLLLLTTTFAYRSLNLLFVFLPTYSCGSIFAEFGFTTDQAGMYVLGEIAKFLALFWLYYWLVQTNENEAPYGTDVDSQQS